MDAVERNGYELIPHPAYSPDLAPSEFFLFPNLKKDIRGLHFRSDEEVVTAVDEWVNGKDPDFFLLTHPRTFPYMCFNANGPFMEIPQVFYVSIFVSMLMVLSWEFHRFFTFPYLFQCILVLSCKSHRIFTFHICFGADGHFMQIQKDLYLSVFLFQCKWSYHDNPTGPLPLYLF